jgi:hypothetical protein
MSRAQRHNHRDTAAVITNRARRTRRLLTTPNRRLGLEYELAQRGQAAGERQDTEVPDERAIASRVRGRPGWLEPGCVWFHPVSR